MYTGRQNYCDVRLHSNPVLNSAQRLVCQTVDNYVDMIYIRQLPLPHGM